MPRGALDVAEARLRLRVDRADDAAFQARCELAPHALDLGKLGHPPIMVRRRARVAIVRGGRVTLARRPVKSPEEMPTTVA